MPFSYNTTFTPVGGNVNLNSGSVGIRAPQPYQQPSVPPSSPSPPGGLGGYSGVPLPVQGPGPGSLGGYSGVPLPGGPLSGNGTVTATSGSTSPSPVGAGQVPSPSPSGRQPLSQFQFTSYEDPAFRQAWSETNQAIAGLPQGLQDRLNKLYEATAGGGGNRLSALRDAYNQLISGPGYSGGASGQMNQNMPGQRPAMSNPLVSSMAGPVGGDQRQAASQWIQSLMQRNPQVLQRLMAMQRGPAYQQQGGPMLNSGGGQVINRPVSALAPRPEPMPYSPNVPNLYNLAVPFGQR